MPALRCKACGKIFLRSYPDPGFCSDRCRKSAATAQQHLKAKCDSCGIVFLKNLQRPKQKWCSTRCRMKVANLRYLSKAKIRRARSKWMREYRRNRHEQQITRRVTQRKKLIEAFQCQG